MCGIVGYIGGQSAAPLILDGLGKLEYRGYDSAGLAVLSGAQIDVRRDVGKLANLRAKVALHPLEGCLALVTRAGLRTEPPPNTTLILT